MNENNKKIDAAPSSSSHTKCFFLTRYELPNKGQCVDVVHRSEEFDSTANCTLSSSFDRVVIVVIDALRYDFCDFDESLEASTYRNRLPTLHRLLIEQPANSLLLRFVADAPTVTMQRLKGITSGSLPTFIDVSDNFQSAEIAEDTWLHRLVDRGRRLAFVGDDSWIMLFPRAFELARPYPSFNVKDLHTVDDGVIEHLPSIIDGEHDGEYDVSIGHMLGVDHVGHRHGPLHAAMRTKLEQMDAFIGRLIDQLDERTLFLLIGDHGMTYDGNHGGATDDEVHAAFFAYSKRPFLSAAPKTRTRGRHIEQIDLVPTLSLLLDAPIPFGSLGVVIDEFFLGADMHADESVHSVEPSAWRRLLQALHLNVEQVVAYLDAYNAVSNIFAPFNETNRAIGRAVYDRVLSGDESVSVRELRDACIAYHTYLRDASAMCRELWATFDLPQMAIGIVLMFVSIGVLLLCDTLDDVRLHKSLRACISLTPTGLGAHLVIGFVASFLFAPDARAIIELFLIVFLLGNAVPWRSLAVFTSRLSQHVKQLTQCRMTTLATLVCIALHGAGLFSNSYIEADRASVQHLLLGLCCVHAVEMSALRPNDSLIYHGLLMVCVRIASACDAPGKQEAALLEEPPRQVLLVTVLPLLPLLYVCSSACSSSLLRLSLRVRFALLAAFWTLCSVTQFDSVPYLGRVLLPQLLYALSSYSLYTSTTWLDIGIQIIPLLLLVLGTSAPLPLLLLVVQFFCLYKILPRAPSPSRSLSRSLFVATVAYLSSIEFFFATNHRYALNSVQWSAAFVGFEEMHWISGFLLVLLNTFGAHFLCAIGAYVIGGACSLRHYQQLHALQAALTLLFVFGARRHLMVWRVFAPKLLFDVVIVLCMDIVVVLVNTLPAGRPASNDLKQK